MLTQTKGHIYLADKRENTVTGFRTTADGLFVNDHLLNGGATCNVYFQEGYTTLLIPYIGDLKILSDSHENLYLEENQAYIFPQNNTDYQIKNPYSEDVINFFEVILPLDNIDKPEHPIEIGIQYQLNQLMPITDKIKIGQFGGREEGICMLKNEKSSVFTFVISGAFEVQNRLLQPRDGLLLSETPVLEFEALSNDAILVLIELP
jgi:hypothetical protein